MRKLIVGLLLLIATTGCLNGPSEMDGMFEKGYGFNNPNASKEKSGRLP